MTENPFGHDERNLEKEMLEAARHVSEVAHVEQDPLLIILWRLNHQDKILDSIRNNLGSMSSELKEHIARDSVIKDSIDEMVATWNGSKIAGRVFAWVVGICAAVGATIATIKRGGP